MTAKNEIVKRKIFGWEKQFKALVPSRDYDINSFMAGAFLAFQNDDNLMEAINTDDGKQSALQELKFAATLGIDLNPARQLGCLVTYKNKDNKIRIKYQTMKNGYLKLAKESGEIENPIADIVREGDHFEICKSDEGDKFTHSIALSKRGDIVGFYAAMRFKDTGKTVVKYMSNEEMKDHRDRYHSARLRDDKGNLKQNTSWNKSYPGMGIKTMLKVLLRPFEISPSLTKAIIHDDKFEAGEPEEKEILNVTPKGASAQDVLNKIKAKEKKEKKTIKQNKKEEEDNPGTFTDENNGYDDEGEIF